MKSQLETVEQKKLIQWLKLKKIFCFSIPNGATLKGTPLQRAKQMNKLKAEGLNTGASDVAIMLPDLILFIELKRKPNKLKSGKLSYTNSKVSDSQKEFLESVNKFSYCEGFVAYGFDGAKEIVEKYL